MKYTTIRDLYNWAVNNSDDMINLLDAPIGIQYQDDGGTYDGDTYEDALRQVEYGNEDFDGTLSISVETDNNGDKYILLGQL